MVEYTLAHIGLNGQNEEEAKETAARFEALFGWKVKVGNSSVFAGGEVEIMKNPYRGAYGHIAVGTPDVAAAVADLESRGYTVDPSTAKYKADGTLNAIYLTGEIGGFAIHLVGKK